MGLTARIIPQFPAIVQGANGVTVATAAGVTTIGFDYNNSEVGTELSQTLTSAQDAESAAQTAQTAAETAQTAAETAAASANGTIPCASIADVQALDTSAKKAAALYGQGGRNGIFLFTSGDQSAKITLDTNQGLYIAPNADTTGASGAWKRVVTENGEYHTLWWGCTTDGTDCSAKIQNALAVMAAENSGRALLMVNDPGVKFDRTAISTLPDRGEMWYQADDDARQNGFSATVSSETVKWLFKSNVDGIVNETHIASAFNPAFVINLLKDAPGQDANLGTGQHRVPDATGRDSRVTFMLADEWLARFQAIDTQYGGPTRNIYSGTQLNAVLPRVTLSVDATTGLLSTVGTKISGLTSNAFGYVVSVDATHVVLDWHYGQFVVGEELYDFSTSARPVVASISMSLPQGQGQFFQKSISWGGAPGTVEGVGPDFGFFGRVLLSPSSNYGQTGNETVTHAAAVFANNPSGAPTSGKQIVLDDNGRLILVDGTTAGTTPLGKVGGLVASVNFDHSATIAGNLNFSSVAYSGSTGIYNCTASITLPTNCHVQVTKTDPTDNPVAFSVSSSVIQIRNYSQTMPASAQNLAGHVYVTAFDPN